MSCTRREFLRAGSLTALGAGLGFLNPEIFKSSVFANSASEDAKMIFIFQRGGNDGVNTVIPYGDPEYNTGNRPSLYIPPARAIDLGNGFAGLHPSMAPMMEIYDHSGLNGLDGPGNLAVIHRVGYAGQSQSHFDGQRYWETGMPGDPTFEEGMIYRQVALTMNPMENNLVAAAMSGSQMVALKGPLPIPTIQDPETFTFSGDPVEVSKFIGRLPSTPQGPDGSGLLGIYGGTPDFPEKLYRDLVYGTGQALANAMSIVQDAVAQGPYEPSPGAVYPAGSFGDRLSQIAMLLKRTPARVLGVNIGGWDTHTNQGQITGQQAGLLAQVARGFQALYRDLQEQWDKLIVVTMTEFGRTSKENGSGGTDHAHATVMFVAGGRVRGGVYNCDASTWSQGDLFSDNERYVRRKTDFRAVFGEIFTRHFGDSRQVLDQVIPSYAQAAQDNPGDFEFLNFLPAV
ncbi:MAG: hypothetical protein A2Z25_05970 [Planctomycetes bacterium RBG_16_55_9]|nr:MAG: hypothetical protein A2Z25_05970 [Planctomycetes bacterium RBG_16_55_9]